MATITFNLMLVRSQVVRNHILPSSCFTDLEKFNQIRHNHTNYDLIHQRLEDDYTNKLDRDRAYNILVGEVSVLIARLFPQLKPIAKAWFNSKFNPNL